ncbi:MAG TPA: hypothetical protein VK859_10755, partial [bacterium]|nr:hypothetical protein [bacterium]
MTSKFLSSIFFLLFAFGAACPSHAYQILFYYNSLDGTEGGLLECVQILRIAGHHVTTIDMNGENRDPTGDNWGAPYDQVWDMRFVDHDTQGCGAGLPGYADYFDEKWRKKAVTFLNHCGKLFIAAEHYQLGDRDEGLYRFLKETAAVKNSYDSCPPSQRGNSTTDGTAFYPVHPGLGPTSFFGAFVGGIPLDLLTGESFVNTSDDWEGDDQVDRSIVSGWKGAQLGGAVRPPSCGEERLFMVWDATMWTLWQPGMEEQNRPDGPIWDESGWFSYNADGTARGNIRDFARAKAVTRKFFPAIAKWLGGRVDCPCAQTGKEATVSAAPTTAPAFQSPLPIPYLPAAQSRLASDSRTTRYITAPDPNAPATILFNSLPVNLYMLFLDGVGT